MKLRLKDLTLEHYLRYIKRQNRHIQHVHAFVFAGTITGLIAIFILYTDYGFWHETYISAKVQEENAQNQESLGGFWEEAKSRFQAIRNGSVLDGMETFVR